MKLNHYRKEIQDGIIKITDSTIDEAKTGLRRGSPRRSGNKTRKGANGKRYAPGSYAKSWGVRVSGKSFSNYSKQVYNRVHYRLTHLLEKGHEARNGKRVAPRVHIAPLERKAVKNYEKRIENLIRKTK